jgi:peptide/nickel transport system substrate-binding protein
MPLARLIRPALTLAAGAAIAFGFSVNPGEAAPKQGGTLKYVVPAEPPSFDGHRETTFALVHPIAPFYSLLMRVKPDEPYKSGNFECDLCTEVPKPTDGGKTYTFKIRPGVKFSDGSALTAHDVAATYKKIASPPQGVASARKAHYSMVDKIETPDNLTVVFKLKYPSGAFMPAMASPYNFIYAKAKLDQDMHWYEKNIMGSGPFLFESRQAGAFVKGKRNPNFYVKGRPYLEGFEAIFADKQSLRVQAIQGNRAAIEFRGFPPNSRDDLVKALGNQITVQESNWNCVLLATPNQKRKPFDDVRVRRALTLGIDRWGGSQYLSKIAIVKAVGGLAFPGHELAASDAELKQLAGYGPDINKSRAEARKLLKEAGQENMKFTLYNRGVDQPYKFVGTWLIDQWKQIGLTVDQKVEPTGPFYANLRSKKDFDVSLDFNCQAVVNPLLDVSKFISDDRAGNQYGGYQDREVDKLFDAMNRSGDVKEQRALMRKFEKRILDEQAHNMITLWWYRIIPHRSYVKGWHVTPSHYLNQQLDTVWIDQSS